jgi:hypothetical protein
MTSARERVRRRNSWRSDGVMERPREGGSNGGCHGDEAVGGEVGWGQRFVGAEGRAISDTITAGIKVSRSYEN